MGNRLLLGAFNVCANSVRVIPAFTADTCSRMSNMRVVVRCWSCAIQVVPFPYRKLPDAGVIYGRMLPISIITSSSFFASNVKAQQKNTRNDRNSHSSYEGDTGQERENRFEIVSKYVFGRQWYQPSLSVTAFSIAESSKPTTSVRMKPATKLTAREIRNGINATVQNTGSVVSAGKANADA